MFPFSAAPYTNFLHSNGTLSLTLHDCVAPITAIVLPNKVDKPCPTTTPTAATSTSSSTSSILLTTTTDNINMDINTNNSPSSSSSSTFSSSSSSSSSTTLGNDVNAVDKFLHQRKRSHGSVDRGKSRYAYRSEYKLYQPRWDHLRQKNLKKLLNKWNFDIFHLDRLTFGHSCTAIALNLFSQHNLLSHFDLDIISVHRTLRCIEESYHSVNPYHTSCHAADVLQAVHWLLMDNNLKPYFEPIEILVALLAAMCHDADHPGLNQAFLVKTHHHLAMHYKGRSVLENHHYRVGLSILHESGLLSNFSNENKTFFYQAFQDLILATDITQQPLYLAKFASKLEVGGGQLDLNERENRMLVLQMILKCGDICNPVRPWSLAKNWANVIIAEFYRQGDRERALHLPILPIMDRHRSRRAQIQVDFIRFLVRPLFEQWERFLGNPRAGHLRMLMQTNLFHWENLQKDEEIRPSSLSTSSPLASASVPQQQPMNVNSAPPILNSNRFFRLSPISSVLGDASESHDENQESNNQVYCRQSTIGSHRKSSINNNNNNNRPAPGQPPQSTPPLPPATTTTASSSSSSAVQRPILIKNWINSPQQAVNLCELRRSSAPPVGLHNLLTAALNAALRGAGTTNYPTGPFTYPPAAPSWHSHPPPPPRTPLSPINGRRGSAPVLGLRELHQINLRRNRRCSHSNHESGLSSANSFSRCASAASSIGVTQ